MSQAKMIAIEGIEGAGKSTVIEFIKSYLTQQDKAYICTREPGGTQIGEQLRDILKAEHSEKLEDVTELLLMYASRTQLFRQVIQPALQNDTWVIADRFELSSYAYQGMGRQLPLDSLKMLSELCLNNFQPDLTLYLDISYETSEQRLKSRGLAKDRIEQEEQLFFERIRQGYLQFAKATSTIQIIDASQNEAEVSLSVKQHLEQLCLQS
jgi:dTMP kinase